MSVDTKSIKLFADDLKKFNGEDRQRFMAGAAEDIACRIVTLAKGDTPVVTGTLRRGWDEGLKSRELKVEGDKYTVSIKNNVYYAEYVEYGHRTVDHKGWVEGQFIATRATDYIRGYVPRIVKGYFNKYMRYLNDRESNKVPDPEPEK